MPTEEEIIAAGGKPKSLRDRIGATLERAAVSPSVWLSGILLIVVLTVMFGR